MASKTLFSLHFDRTELLLTLQDEDVGKVIKALIHYGNDSTFDDLSELQKFAFETLKLSFDILKSLREKSAEAHREAGLKGGRPRKIKSEDLSKKQKESISCQKNQMKPKGFSENQKKRDRDRDGKPLNPPSHVEEISTEKEQGAAENSPSEKIIPLNRETGEIQWA
jgi:uncharacterized protein YdaU (DUF1376 family)